MAQTSQLEILGQKVQVTDLQYREAAEGKKVIHQATLVGPVTFEFARGNKMTFDSKIIFHDNGSPWMMQAKAGEGGFIDWKLSDGQIIKLNCNQPPNTSYEPTPIKQIVFYSNAELAMGCKNGHESRVKTKDQGQVLISSFTDLDFTSDGYLKYAAKIKEGFLVVYGQKIELKPNSSLDLHDDSSPHFFAMNEGSLLRVETERLGSVTLAQTARTSYTKFDIYGRLEAGTLGQSVNYRGLDISEGSLLSFEELAVQGLPKPISDIRELSILFAKPSLQNIADQEIVVSQLRFNGADELIGAVNAQAFIFKSPEGNIIPVSANSKIYISKGAIVQIDAKN